jgi:hypothetical protein
MNCPECGAADGACEDHYYECLVKEFSDPAYGIVHHLTVSIYMIQHSSKLTKEGWLFERGLLREFLIDKKPPAYIRKQNRDVVDSGKRTFKIKDKDGLPKINRTQWNRTILDVRLDDAAQYCADVEAWALSVLGEAELVEILQSASPRG